MVLAILAAALLMLMYPQQYYNYVAPIVSPKRISQRIRDVDSVQSHQVLGLLRNAYTSDFPLVIRGGVNHWYAAGRWTPAHVREEVGRNSWILLQSGVQEQEASPFINTTMGAFTDWLEKQEEEEKSGKQRASTDPTYYLAEEFAFVEQHEGLVSELGLHDLDEFWESSNQKGRRSSNSYNNKRKKKKWSLSETADTLLSSLGSMLFGGAHRSNGFASLSESDGIESAFWMGGAGARTGWHIDHDYPLNVLCHLYGTKTLWIAGPDQSHNMYPSNKYDPGAVLGSVNFWSPDFKANPDYSRVTYEEITLNPGDMLFIPMGYWHAAESTTYTTSLSLRSMTLKYWLLNFPDRLLEQLFFRGWWTPVDGSVAIEETILKKEL